MKHVQNDVHNSYETPALSEFQSFGPVLIVIDEI